MLTDKIQHLTTNNQGAEIIVMHPELMPWTKTEAPKIKKIEEPVAANMPEQPTSYLRPKKHDFL